MTTHVVHAVSSSTFRKLLSTLYAQIELPDLDISQLSTFPKATRSSLRELQRHPPRPKSGILGVTSTELMHRFLEKLTRSIKDQLSVGGLSTDDNQLHATALINGMTFHPGEIVPLDLDENSA